VNVLGVQSKSDKEQQNATINITLEVQTLTQLSKVISQMQGLPNIISVDRV
jgi:(p)ppGpp synthase/HD superfamily hydrolase